MTFLQTFFAALGIMAALASMFITIAIAFTVAVWLGWVALGFWTVVYAAVLAGVVSR